MQNWCHVERLLQAASEFLPAQYVLKSDEVVVIVNRPKNGWWNQDDATLIYNTMAHVEIVRAYLKVGNLSRFEMPRFCNRGSLSVIKAVLHARSVSTVAAKELSRETAALLRNDKIGFIVFQFTKDCP